MLDFFVVSKRVRNGRMEVYPKFIVKKSNDLMVRGGDFYAIWNEEKGLWSTSEDDAISMIDRELDNYVKNTFPGIGETIDILHLWDSDTKMIDNWHRYVQIHLRDNFHPLDETLIFSDTPISKENYASKRLPYPLKEGPIECYDKLIGTLYSPEERHKLEWAIGAVVSGDSKTIQKFIVLYGSPGSGKSTVLNIIQQLFDGYYSTFDAKALGSSSNAFALEAFRTNPLVAIQHDGDLSRIEDNTRLNSVVSHELMIVNEKFKSTYSSRFKSFLFMGTNKPVKISDAKSGILRRLIDVSPTGNKVPLKEYKRLTEGLKFELGGIAKHCLDIYEEDKDYYDSYIPINMMSASNYFYDFVLSKYDIFYKEDGITLKSAWEMYKVYCDDAKIGYPLNRITFKEELKNYFKEFSDQKRLDDGTRVRSYYSGFLTYKFDSGESSDSDSKEKAIIKSQGWLEFSDQHSLFDDEYAQCYAQYATEDEIPKAKWEKVKTILSDILTNHLHYVKVPANHIVIDFDLKDENGEKSLEKNLEAANKWPKTYAELSKSGKGIHLHYIYDGDADKLSRIYEENIEIKVFIGGSSLRRKLTKCNDIPVAHISAGLPLREEKKVLDEREVKSERALRELIGRNLRKEIMPSTRQSIDFIAKILDDAYNSSLIYDVSDMKSDIYAFASCATHQSEYCINKIGDMKFASKQEFTQVESAEDDFSDLIFFDVEVFRNLFVICYKRRGSSHDVVCLINPDRSLSEDFLSMRLVGFNNREYDNHIIYAWMLGFTNFELYQLSQSIINDQPGAKYGAAYDLSFTDIYDFCAKKQSLKKWEIELGIHHQELGLKWDEEVPEELWTTVGEYCKNDVIATEATFEANYGDFEARLMLAAISGGKPNDKTNSLTAKIIFGNDKRPELVYTDLATGISTDGTYNEWNKFDGYEYKTGPDGKYHNYYMGEEASFGGYVYSEPGIYYGAMTFDVASMHPNSIIALNAFGKYTARFKDILDARIAIKHKDFEKARTMLGGALAPYLEDTSKAKSIAQALKIAINSVYGLTSAKFDNPFRDKRNVNNIVALRGALMMIKLKHLVQEKGFRVIQIKTDSIKIEHPTEELQGFIMDYGHKFGYTFEVEHTFERLCLVNKAVFIAKYGQDDPDAPGKWEATGAQFAQKYVFKTLFSKEPITFDDLCETKSCNTAIYLDMNEGFEDVSGLEKELEKQRKAFLKGKITEEEWNSVKISLQNDISKGHNYQFIGKVGLFVPIMPGCGGGVLYREKDGKYYAASGTQGYRWLEAESVKALGIENKIDMSYFRNLVDEAVHDISEYGDFEVFTA